VKQDGILMMGGFSPNNIKALFGAVNDSVEDTGATKPLDPEAILNWILEHYQ
jgi:hypothetical protein